VLYRIDDPDTFKRANLSTWKDNTAFWLQGKMRHLVDLNEFMARLLDRELLDRRSEDGTVVDVGCGEGWVLRSLRSRSQSCTYIGLDFNDAIISALKDRHADDPNVTFLLHDIEGPPPPTLLGRADLVVCCFSLFEMPRLEEAIASLASLLNRDGRILVLSIEPLAQLIAISRNWEDLHANLAQYQLLGSHAGYDKDIDVGAIGSGRIYRGILYSPADYVRAAAESDLVVHSIDRIVCTANRVPQVYDAIVWRPGGNGRE